MTDEEFRRMLLLVSDSDMVSAGHLKDIAAWIRNEGKAGHEMGSSGLVQFSESVIKWMVDDVMSRRKVC